jgi:hypothetical protein
MFAAQARNMESRHRRGVSVEVRGRSLRGLTPGLGICGSRYERVGAEAQARSEIMCSTKWQSGLRARRDMGGRECEK